MGSRSPSRPLNGWSVPPNGPVLARVTAALERMGSGYSAEPSESGEWMIFRHPDYRNWQPFILSTRPWLTLGDALATVFNTGIDPEEFMKHYPITEFG